MAVGNTGLTTDDLAKETKDPKLSFLCFPRVPWANFRVSSCVSWAPRSCGSWSQSVPVLSDKAMNFRPRSGGFLIFFRVYAPTWKKTRVHAFQLREQRELRGHTRFLCASHRVRTSTRPFLAPAKEIKRAHAFHVHHQRSLSGHTPFPCATANQPGPHNLIGAPQGGCAQVIDVAGENTG